MTTANTTKSNIHDDSIDSTSRRLAHGPILAALPTNWRAPTLFKTRSGKLTDVERTQWPRIGGIKDGPIRGVEFGEDFIKHYEPGVVAVGYVAGCLMLRERAQAYHIPLAKAGWTQLPNLLDRQEDLNHDSYGGWRWIDGELVKQAGCQWEMQRTSLAYAPHPQSPLRLVDRGISVRLPRSYVFKQFEKDIHREMRSCALVNFAESKAGQAHFRRLGVEVASVTHVTAYGFGSARRTNKALEIYLMRPRQDVSRIAFIAERLVHAHVLARSGARSA